MSEVVIESQNKRLISQREVMDRVPYGRTTIWKLIKQNKFPQPVKIGGNRVAFVDSEICSWIDEQIAERDGGQADA